MIAECAPSEWAGFGLPRVPRGFSGHFVCFFVCELFEGLVTFNLRVFILVLLCYLKVSFIEGFYMVCYCFSVFVS